MPTRNRPSSRNQSTDDSNTDRAYDYSPLDETELNEISDDELDHMFSPASGGSSSRFGRIATATGIGMMLVLSLFLIAEFTSMGFLSSSLGIGLVGMMMAIIGFGVFSGRKKKAKTSSESSKSSSKHDKDSIEEQVEAKLREARAALDAEKQSDDGASNLRRSTDKKVFGVCAGLGEYFGIDIALVRAAFLVGLFLSGGQLALVYFGMAYIMPKPEDA